MKIKKLELRKPETFTPFEFTITVESKEEARALYAIFNYSPNVELLPPDHRDIRYSIGHEFAGCGVIANGITYREFYVEKKTG